MRLLLALLALSLPVCFAETKTSSPAPAPAPALPKPTPAKDAATVRFEKFELKETTLIDALRGLRQKAYHQGDLIEIVLHESADGSLGDRHVAISLHEATVGEVMLTLSRIADFKYAIKGNVITVDPK